MTSSLMIFLSCRALILMFFPEFFRESKYIPPRRNRRIFSCSPAGGGDGGADQPGVEVVEALDVGADPRVLRVGFQLGHRGAEGAVGVDEFAGGEGEGSCVVHDLFVLRLVVGFHSGSLAQAAALAASRVEK